MLCLTNVQEVQCFQVGQPQSLDSEVCSCFSGNINTQKPERDICIYIVI